MKQGADIPKGVAHDVGTWSIRCVHLDQGYRMGGVYSIFMHGRSRMAIAIRPSHPHNVRTEHVGFSPTRQTLFALSSKRREVFGESHEG